MIEINGINKWYGKHHVLKDCSTHVDKGDIVVVCGPSGSGKSTLIKTVNGLEPIQRGDIRVEGISTIDPRTDLARLRPPVGMVFRSEERSVGKECVSTCSSRWVPAHSKKNRTSK